MGPLVRGAWILVVVAGLLGSRRSHILGFCSLWRRQMILVLVVAASERLGGRCDEGLACSGHQGLARLKAAALVRLLELHAWPRGGMAAWACSA